MCPHIINVRFNIKQVINVVNIQLILENYNSEITIHIMSYEVHCNKWWNKTFIRKIIWTKDKQNFSTQYNSSCIGFKSNTLHEHFT